MTDVRLVAHADKGSYVELRCNFGTDADEPLTVCVLLTGPKAEALSNDDLDLLGRPIRKWIGRNLATFRGPAPRVIPLDELH